LERRENDKGSITAWLDAVYRDHSQQVFRTCLRLGGGNRQWALDRVQEVFLILVEKHDQVRDRTNPGGWLYRMAVNACYMALRRQRVRSRVLQLFGRADESLSPSPDARVSAHSELTSLERSLSLLPAKQGIVMMLMYVEQKTQTEVASLLSLSKGQVSKLHAKAVETLRAQSWSVDDA
jgi:RNA polymerase sigma factor (sigma-70 family)